MNYEIKCRKCNHVSDQVYGSDNIMQFQYAMNIFARSYVLSDCEICSKQTVHDLVSFDQIKLRQEPELTDQQKDLIERCNK